MASALLHAQPGVASVRRPLPAVCYCNILLRCACRCPTNTTFPSTWRLLVSQTTTPPSLPPIVPTVSSRRLSIAKARKTRRQTCGRCPFPPLFMNRFVVWIDDRLGVGAAQEDAGGEEQAVERA